MPVIALCPYCVRGRVRASADAIGKTVTCPDCRADFAFIPSDEPAVAASAASVSPFSSGMIPAVHATELAPPKPKKRPVPLKADEPAVVSKPVPKPPDETLPNAASLPPDPDSVPDPARTAALVAATLGGLGLACSQIPDYGRLACAAVTGVGLVIGLFSLLGAEQGRRWPGFATGLSAVGLLLSVLLPTWLGQTTWWPDRGLEPDRPAAVGFDGETKPAGDWIDATKAEWMKDGVRVTLVEVRRGPVELIGGPKKQRKMSKDEALHVVVRVTNSVAGRPVEIAGSKDGVKLTDGRGEPIAPKKFDPGWTPTAGDGGKGQRLSVGLSVELPLYYDPPSADGGGTGRLEIPALIVGGADPVRFRIPLTAYQENAHPGGKK